MSVDGFFKIKTVLVKPLKSNKLEYVSASTCFESRQPGSRSNANFATPEMCVITGKQKMEKSIDFCVEPGCERRATLWRKPPPVWQSGHQEAECGGSTAWGQRQPAPLLDWERGDDPVRHLGRKDNVRELVYFDFLFMCVCVRLRYISLKKFFYWNTVDLHCCFIKCFRFIATWSIFVCVCVYIYIYKIS